MSPPKSRIYFILILIYIPKRTCRMKCVGHTFINYYNQGISLPYYFSWLFSTFTFVNYLNIAQRLQVYFASPMRALILNVPVNIGNMRGSSLRETKALFDFDGWESNSLLMVCGVTCFEAIIRKTNTSGATFNRFLQILGSSDFRWTGAELGRQITWIREIFVLRKGINWTANEGARPN